MSKFIQSAKVETTITVQLTEAEFRALHSLSMYGPDTFVEYLAKFMQESDLAKNGAGLRSLLHAIRDEGGSIIKKADGARLVLQGKTVVP